MKDAQGHGSNPRGGIAAHMRGVLKATKPIKLKPDAVQQMHDSLKTTGGFSATPRGRTPENGYMVSAPGRSKIVPESQVTPQTISDYANEHSDALRQSGAHIGGWTDKETGLTHLDVSHKIGSRNRAISAGKSRNQIAIWDVSKGREIRTGGTGG